MTFRFTPVFLCLAACSAGDGKVALNKPTFDSLPGGVVRVTNTGPTEWADTSGWRLVEERTISGDEGTPGELTDISGIAADAAGNVYVMQRKPAVIKAYGPDGAWLRDIGREGSGPGEFESGMFGIIGDTLFVQDSNNSRLTTFLTSGQFLSSYRSQCCWWASRFPIFDDGTVGILGPPPDSTARGGVYLTRMNGTVVDTILMPKQDDDLAGLWTVTRKFGNNTSMMARNVPLRPSDESAYLRIGGRVTGNTATYQLAITDLDSDTLRLFSASAPSVTIDDAQRDSIYEAEIDDAGEQWRDAFREVAKKADIPGSWPVWSEVNVDGRGRIWVARPGARGKFSYLDVFSSEGVLLGSLVAPPKFEFGGRWVGDRLYLQSETEEGLPLVRVFRVDTGPRNTDEKADRELSAR